MLKEIVEYLWSIVEQYPAGKRLRAYLRFGRTRVDGTLRRRPALILVAFALIAAWAIVDPKILPPPFRPAHTCHDIPEDAHAFEGPNGDRIPQLEARSCAAAQTVALEYYNWTKLDPAPAGQQQQGFVSAGLFLNGVSLPTHESGTWFERSVFAGGNFFSWTAEQHRSRFFLKGGCGFDARDTSNIDRREMRTGIILTGLQFRAHPPKKEQLDQCNRANPDDPDFAWCNWGKIQFFVQTDGPHPWCVHRSAFDRWRHSWSWSGTRAIEFASHRDELRSVAGTRRFGHEAEWRRSGVGSMTEARWLALSSDMPKLCIRRISKDGEASKDTTPWQEQGSISRVWCDD